MVFITKNYNLSWHHQENWDGQSEISKIFDSSSSKSFWMEKTWFGNLKYNGNLTVSAIVYLQQGTTNNKLTKFFLVLSDARISCSAILKSSIVGTCGKSGASLKSWHIFWMVSSIWLSLYSTFLWNPLKIGKVINKFV